MGQLLVTWGERPISTGPRGQAAVIWSWSPAITLTRLMMLAAWAVVRPVGLRPMQLSSNPRRGRRDRGVAGEAGRLSVPRWRRAVWFVAHDTDADPDHDERGHDEHGDGVSEFAHRVRHCHRLKLQGDIAGHPTTSRVDARYLVVGTENGRLAGEKAIKCALRRRHEPGPILFTGGAKGPTIKLPTPAQGVSDLESFGGSFPKARGRCTDGIADESSLVEHGLGTRPDKHALSSPQFSTSWYFCKTPPAPNRFINTETVALSLSPNCVGPTPSPRKTILAADRRLCRIVLATTPFPASPMDTYTGLERPGTVTLMTRMEYLGEVAGTDPQAIEADAMRRCEPHR